MAVHSNYDWLPDGLDDSFIDIALKSPFYSALEKKMAQEISDLRAAQTSHLKALRIVSQSLGDPFKGDTKKNCIDLAKLAAAKLKTQDEANTLAHAMAYEMAVSAIEGASTALEGEWFDISTWDAIDEKGCAECLRYLDMRGLVEREEGQPHIISFRNESEATHG